MTSCNSVTTKVLYKGYVVSMVKKENVLCGDSISCTFFSFLSKAEWCYEEKDKQVNHVGATVKVLNP